MYGTLILAHGTIRHVEVLVSHHLKHPRGAELVSVTLHVVTTNINNLKFISSIRLL
jgi:hypothetical protein